MWAAEECHIRQRVLMTENLQRSERQGRNWLCSIYPGLDPFDITRVFKNKVSMMIPAKYKKARKISKVAILLLPENNGEQPSPSRRYYRYKRRQHGLCQIILLRNISQLTAGFFCSKTVIMNSKKERRFPVTFPGISFLGYCRYSMSRSMEWWM